LLLEAVDQFLIVEGRLFFDLESDLLCDEIDLDAGWLYPR
jgi:hypothetical protein